MRHSVLGDQFLQVGDDLVRFEYQHVAFQGIQHHLGGVADQRAGQPGACHRAEYGHRRAELVRGVRDEDVGRDAEVEAMLQDSILHAREDIATRALVEAKTEAYQITETAINFIEKHRQHLAEDEIAKTTKAIEELQTIAGTDNKDLIQAKIEELNEITKPFSERIMDLAVRTAMKGKKI